MNTDSGRYKITQVTHSDMYHPVNGPVQTKVLHYRLRDGTQGKLEIPESDYNRDNVQQLMDNVATNHEHVMTLNDPANQQVYYQPSGS